MNIVVCVKYVPDPQGTPLLGPDNLLVRSNDGALDPGDEYGLEMALRLVESGGEVTALCMGPEEATAAVQRALAMGADKGVLITDPSLRGSDALATSKVLAAAIGRQQWDLVIAGAESTDGYTGTVPMTVAEMLSVPAVLAVRKLEPSGGSVRVERQTEGGYDVIESPLPALVSVTAGATEPRYPSLKGIMSAKQKPVERLTISDLGLNAEDVAATQTITHVTDAQAKAGGEVVQAGPEAVTKIADLLAEAKVI